ncbi:MAG TPA: glycosyltransferase family 4 protein, partial [Longimicrobiaceae bacterium]|nr:glycosyltransferase family 4 protein [Longimicrobiaceae bacterium]
MTAAPPPRPPRLVHVTTVPMSLVFLRGQVGYMRALGYRVWAVSSPGPALERFGADEGVEVVPVAMERRITPLRDLAAVRRLAARLARIRPDVVHAHTPKGGLLGMLAAALLRVPVRVYHLRGLAYKGAAGVRRALLRAADRTACALAHRVICVSHSAREAAVRDGVCPPGKVTVLLGGSGNGVDAAGRFDPARLPTGAGARTRARFGIPPDAAVVGFVGRLVGDKGIVELVRAWASLREEFPGARLLLVGPWEARDPVAPEVRAALEGDPRVHLAGEDWDTPPLFAAMDLLALPTYREGFPNVLLEAAAMELPVVATRVPGCVDAVRDGETGTLVPARDAEALAGALARYLRDPALRAAHGRAGRARVLREFRREDLWR